MLSIGIILFLLVWGIIFWINKITKKPTTQNKEKDTEKKAFWKLSWFKFQWNLKFGRLVIIILIIGFIFRMSTPYSEEKILQVGESYSFNSSWENVEISPQSGCVMVIFPNKKNFSVCVNTPIDIGNTGSGNYKITATENNQMIVISRIPSTIGKKFVFWINPKNYNLLFK